MSPPYLPPSLCLSLPLSLCLSVCLFRSVSCVCLSWLCLHSMIPTQLPFTLSPSPSLPSLCLWCVSVLLIILFPYTVLGNSRQCVVFASASCVYLVYSVSVSIFVYLVSVSLVSTSLLLLWLSAFLPPLPISVSGAVCSCRNVSPSLLCVCLLPLCLFVSCLNLSGCYCVNRVSLSLCLCLFHCSNVSLVITVAVSLSH